MIQGNLVIAIERAQVALDQLNSLLRSQVEGSSTPCSGPVVIAALERARIAVVELNQRLQGVK